MTTAFLKTPARSSARRSPPPREPVHDHDKPPPTRDGGGGPRIPLVHVLLEPGSRAPDPGLALTYSYARPLTPTRSSLPPRAPNRPDRPSAIEVEDNPTD